MKKIQDFRHEFIENGGDMDGCLSLRRMEDISDWIKQVQEFSSPETCPKPYVPQTQFICLRGNIASRKVILNNGGVYESTVYEPDEKVYLERYWIILKYKIIQVE